MAIISTACPVLGGHVTCVTDLDGRVTHVLCGKYEPSSGTCRLKAASRTAGPLAQLLERVSESSLDTHDMRCVLRER